MTASMTRLGVDVRGYGEKMANSGKVDGDEVPFYLERAQPMRAGAGEMSSGVLA